MTRQIRVPITLPTAIDPYRAQELMGITVTKALYDGLLRLDGRGRLRGCVAETWQADESGTRWTFRLGVRSRFSTGERVTAHHFVHAWTRACCPEADSETTYHMASIEGYQARRFGTAAELTGVSAPDAQTLVVQLAEPDFEFDLKVLQPVFSPVPLDSGPALGERFNRLPVGNGPLMLAGPWTGQETETIELVANPHYSGHRPYGGGGVAVEVLAPHEARDEAGSGLLSGRFDVAQVKPADDTGHLSLLTTRLNATIYLLPFLHHGPMADAAVRRAVANALDRPALAEAAGVDQEDITDRLVPFGLWGQDAPAERAPVTGEPPRPREGLEPIAIVHNVEGGHERWVELAAQQITAALGVAVEPSQVTAAEVVDFRTSYAARGMCRAGWMADYPSADNFLFPLLHSSCTSPDAQGRAHGDNEGRYADAEFDALVVRARSEKDPGRREELRRAAEEIAITRDNALIPLWHATDRRWYDPQRVRGVRVDRFGCLALDELRPADEPAGRVVVVGGRYETLAAAADAGIDVIDVQHPTVPVADIGPGRVEHIVADYTDDEVLGELAARDPRLAGAAGALSLTEPGSVPAAHLRAALGVPGHGPEVASTLRDKLAMREALASTAYGLRHARVATPGDLRRAGEEWGFPFIVKPADGTASVGVELIGGPADIEPAWARLAALAGSDRPYAELFGFATFLAEEFVDGPEYSVEAFSVAGEHVVLGVTEKITDDGFVESGHIFPARIDEIARKALTEATTAVLDALGVSDGPTHSEFRLGAGGPALIESHDRMGGDRIFDLIRLATGFDIEQATVLRAAGLLRRPFEPPAVVRSAATRFLAARQDVRSVGLDDSGTRVAGYVDHAFAVPQARPGGTGNGNWDRLGQVVTVGGDGDAALAAAEEVLKHVRIETSEGQE
ncbi:ABC transporter substrate-binding protein [Myceligenerans crystallogenes]|uniref:ATP-grasp domain-containing protein n=1 Tax=Myceligenerans crystallogenes TaxID=316335 RepID=A0ABP4ZKN5_9MICO